MSTQRRIYEFDNFRVDTGQFLLTKAGQAQPISPTAFKILLMLLERAGEPVNKADLMKHVWPDCFVEEGNLNRNVSTLRKALDERPSDHRYIETIPKSGYRFIAPVRVTDYRQPGSNPSRTSPRTVHQVVGREFERDVLSRAYDRVQQGQGCIVCVSGDIGMGKTALVETFTEDLLRDGQLFHVASSRCSESFAESEPLMPWIETLSSFAGDTTVGPLIKKAAPNWYREITHTGPGVPQKMKRELVDFCRELSPVHPLVLVMDDFHWADVPSVDLLSFLATHLHSLRVLVVVCYRLVDMKIRNHPFLRLRSDLLGRGGFTELRLAPLTHKHVDLYLALEHAHRKFSPEFAGALFAKCEGNPLFMKELLGANNQVSDSMRHMIQSQLDRLDDTRRQLLMTASVQGREFDSAVLAATMQMESQDVEETLHELDEVHGLIHRIREEELLDGKFTVRYRFAYGLYQEACYTSLAPTRKASLSASLAQAFLTYYGN
jgi:DNA-binding winged helix-turn-helix (wHTH) protein/predicted ATPase